LRTLVAQAMDSRPELKRSQTLTAAAKADQNGATYGPLIPTISAQAFGGGLGHNLNRVGAQEDYFVGLTWRIGPGGLFDYTRRDAATARLNQTRLGTEKLRDSVVLQVVEAFTRLQSLEAQVDLTKRSLAAAEEGLRLSQQRKEFAVGVVLENIIAEQDLTRARADYLRAVAEFNKTLYAVNYATGKL
jgi:OMF family outer membrane factor